MNGLEIYNTCQQEFGMCMPAFIFLGKKRNISIDYNILTIYDHTSNNGYQPGWLQLPLTCFDSVGRSPVVIERHEPDHKYCHEDSFDLEKPHYHKQFTNLLDLPLLFSIRIITLEINTAS